MGGTDRGGVSRTRHGQTGTYGRDLKKRYGQKGRAKIKRADAR